MTGPVAFGLARLAEEEAAAQAARRKRRAPWRLAGTGNRRIILSASANPDLQVADPICGTVISDHIVRHDPARELRDIGNKRALLAEHHPYDCLEPAGQRCDTCVGREVYPNGVAVHQAWPCTTVRRLIARWDDHADYRQEWKP